MELKVVLEVAVVVINRLPLIFGLMLCWQNATGAILPEQRADALYHGYEGGGVEITGPSYLVRKNFGDKISVKGTYYVDMISGATIDVLATGASEYEEERTEYSLGLDYLNDRTLMSLSFTNSTENDMISDTVNASISQEFFGDLSTFTLSYTQGDDTVKATGNEAFEDSATRHRYSVALSQILTRKFIASFSYEGGFDEGFLRNPYRRARYESGTSAPFFAGSLQEALCPKDDTNQGGECYPETRNSDAFALRGIYSLTPYSSVRAEYRLFSDSWGIESDNYELRYAHQLGRNWLFELRYRFYDQGKGADFYRDLFPNPSVERFTYYARDKELSQYTSTSFGFGVTYTFSSRYKFFDGSTLNFQWDTLQVDFENFRDARPEQTARYGAGQEPFYSLEADIIRVYFSAFF